MYLFNPLGQSDLNYGMERAGTMEERADFNRRSKSGIQVYLLRADGYHHVLEMCICL